MDFTSILVTNITFGNPDIKHWLRFMTGDSMSILCILILCMYLNELNYRKGNKMFVI
jgi:hypothetical protein